MKEAARYCEFGNLKTMADSGAVTLYCWITNVRKQIKSVGTSSTKPERYNRQTFCWLLSSVNEPYNSRTNRTNRMKQFPLRGTVNYEREQPVMQDFCRHPQQSQRMLKMRKEA